jgi:hypothetical protein
MPDNSCQFVTRCTKRALVGMVLHQRRRELFPYGLDELTADLAFEITFHTTSCQGARAAATSARPNAPATGTRPASPARRPC